MLRDRLDLDSDVRLSLDLPEDAPGGRGPVAKVRSLAAMLHDLESRRRWFPGIAERNAARLARLLGLTETERALLGFAVTARADPGLQECLKSQWHASTNHVSRIVGLALDRPACDVARALSATAPLCAMGLVRLGDGAKYSPGIDVTDGVGAVLLRPHRRDDTLVSCFARASRRARLDIRDFEHMRGDVDLVVGALAGALRKRARGVSLLLHGTPGSGKTELVRAVAKHLGAKLYEVTDSDDDGDAMHGPGRLDSCALAQRFLQRSERTLLLFDEVEDVFPVAIPHLFGWERRASDSKSYMHRVIEETPVPTVWACNSIGHVDRATLRRFDLVVGFRTPPKPVRKAILERCLAGQPVSAGSIEVLASDERLAPGHAEKARRLARLLGTRDPKVLEPALRRALDSAMALAGPKRSPGAPCADAVPYDLAFVNASVDLESLAASLDPDSPASVCLHGPPGTGKTAFVRHLADRLGRSLHMKRASDLLSPWVGQTEQKIAEMFRSALQERAVLLLDEADSFLRNRAGAQHSWEVTQVNELLVQMEAHEGLFFCATNCFEALDTASLRRFALKIRFDPLRAEQRLAMLRAVVGGEVTGEVAIRARLSRLDSLTPGDFAAVARRMRILGRALVEAEIVRGLEEECALKPGGGRERIGFASQRAEDGAPPRGA
jgi:SpoVK/Ycf46/Vps4 family AAA+-type ATPase